MKKRPLSVGCLVVVIVICTITGLLRKEPVDFSSLDRQRVCIRGTVYQKEVKNSGGQTKTVLYLKQVSFPEDRQEDTVWTTIRKEQGRKRVQNVSCSLKEGEPEPEMGTTVIVAGTLKNFQKPTNPGQFNAPFYYQILRISFRLDQAEIQVKSDKQNYVTEALWQLRKSIGRKIDCLLPEQEASVMKTMLLGEKGILDEEIKELYQRNGIAHILAISGLHISMIGMGLYKLLRKAGMRIGPGAVLSSVVMILYGIMTGFAVSAVRAIAMFLLQMLAQILGRTYDRITALAVAAVLVLIGQPLYLFHSGFLFSFLCVLGISMLLPVLGNVRRGKKLTEGAAMMTVTLPVSLRFFYQIPMYSMFLNFLVLPLMSILMAAGILMVLAAFLWSPLGVPASWLVTRILMFYEKLGLLAQRLPNHYWTPGCPAMWQVAVYVIILIVVSVLGRTRHKELFYKKDKAYRDIMKQSGRNLHAERGMGSMRGMEAMRDVGLVRSVGSVRSVKTMRDMELLRGMESVSNVGLMRGTESVRGVGLMRDLESVRGMKTMRDMESLRSMGSVRDVGLTRSMENEKERKRSNDRIWSRKRIPYGHAGEWILKYGLPVWICWGMVILGVVVLTWRFRPELQVTFLDVGQGDCIFLQTKDGDAYLCDGGSSSVSNVGKYRILPFLKYQGASHIKAVLVSHEDSDHCNGIVELLEGAELEGITIENLILPDIAEECRSDGYEELVQLAKKNGIAVRYVSRGQQFRDGNLTFQCLHPEQNYRTEDTNEASMVLLVTKETFSMLLTGDVQGDGERMVTEELKRQTEHLTVLKAAHHGSKNSTSEEFLRQADPEVAIISCGEGNRYGHPHAETLERLEKAEIPWLCTKDYGAVTLTLDQKNRMKLRGYIICGDKAPEDITREETMREDAMSEDIMREDTMSEDIMRKDATNEDIMREDTMSEDIMRKDATNEDIMREDIKVNKS